MARGRKTKNISRRAARTEYNNGENTQAHIEIGVWVAKNLSANACYEQEIKHSLCQNLYIMPSTEIFLHTPADGW